ncbi:MAG: hypothetical protein JWN57_908, partial [Frankiales bacterium]|nr:hypothetical protein [Frankiales bacterium]
SRALGGAAGALEPLFRRGEDPSTRRV